MRLMAIDYGRVHTGVAIFDNGRIYTDTFGPWELLLWIDFEHGYWDVIVGERWVPYPGAISGTAWKELLESKQAGAIEWECRKHKIPYVEQPTSIKTPTQAKADHLGYTFRGRNQHEKDAELHMFRYLTQEVGLTPQ